MRGTAANLPPSTNKVGLPVRVILYTPDQIAAFLNVEEKAVKAKYLYYEGRSTGLRKRGLMIARNIAPADEKPEWRIAERELIRWLKFKGFRMYETGTVVS